MVWRRLVREPGTLCVIGVLAYRRIGVSGYGPVGPVGPRNPQRTFRPACFRTGFRSA